MQPNVIVYIQKLQYSQKGRAVHSHFSHRNDNFIYEFLLSLRNYKEVKKRKLLLKLNLDTKPKTTYLAI